jgi:hypothetical protein
VLAEALSNATSGWGHMPWLAARLVAGLFVVFGVMPVPWAMYNPEKMPSANYPLHVFIDYWGWVARDLNHLWLAIAVSVIVGLFATEIIRAWNRLVIRLLEYARLKGKIINVSLRVLNLINPNIAHGRNEIEEISSAVINYMMKDAEFRVWLLGYQNGAPVKYLDWHGFNATLATMMANAYLLLTQLWILWGLYDVVSARVTESLSEWSFTLAGKATAEWLVILLFLGFFTLTSYATYTRWRRTLNDTWASLYEMWQKTQRDSA